MGVASHLKIDLADYDRRIRTFIPWYEEMLAAAAGALALARAPAPRIVDLGIGTGALAEACLRVRPRARLVGVDSDAGMLAAAARRLRPIAGDLTLVAEDFERWPIGHADAVVASLSLHHIAARARKRRLFARARAALRRGGLFVSADCVPAGDEEIAKAQHAAWRDHMLQSYSPRETSRYFRAWAREDIYVPLDVELELLTEAGFTPEVVWRRGPFAVIVGRR